VCSSLSKTSARPVGQDRVPRRAATEGRPYSTYGSVREIRQPRSGWRVQNDCILPVNPC